MADILMVAELGDKSLCAPDSNYRLDVHPWIDFVGNEEWMTAYDHLWRACFRSHGKHARIFARVDWVVTARAFDNILVGAALAVVIGEKWSVEYVMSDPGYQRRHVGTDVMRHLMWFAGQQGGRWAILNCDPEKDNGKLPAFYAKFGFRPFGELAKV